MTTQLLNRISITINELKEYKQTFRSRTTSIEEIINWLDKEHDDCLKRIFKGKLRALKSLERNEKNIAEEIIKFNFLLQHIEAELREEKEKLSEKYKEINKINSKLEQALGKINRIGNIKEEEMVTYKDIKKTLNEIGNIFNLLFNLEKKAKRANQIILIAREIIEEKRNLLEEGIMGLKVKALINKIGQKKIEEYIKNSLEELKELSL